MNERAKEFVRSDASVSEVESLRQQVSDAGSRKSSDSLALLGETIHRTKLDKGWTVTTPDSWEDENQIPADLALIHSEVSEALEAFRRGDADAFAVELADVVIRVIGLSHGLEIDLARAINEKVEKNKNRPFKHDGKRL